MHNINLLAENEFNAFILQNAPSAIYILNISNPQRIQHVWSNTQYAELLGYNKGKNAPMPNYFEPELFYHPDDLPFIQKSLTDLEDPKTNFALPFRCKTREGHYKWTFNSGRILNIQNETFILALSSDADRAIQHYTHLVDQYARDNKELKKKLLLLKLSKTEREVLYAITKGLSVNTIAKERNRSIETIRKQKKSIFLKLKVNHTSELIVKALDAGIY